MPNAFSRFVFMIASAVIPPFKISESLSINISTLKVLVDALALEEIL